MIAKQNTKLDKLSERDQLIEALREAMRYCERDGSVLDDRSDLVGCAVPKNTWDSWVEIVKFTNNRRDRKHTL